jgi:acyl-coenzyme A synthetase/AMP-(fatty) acid ligase
LQVHGPEKVGVLEAGLFPNPAPSLTKPGEVVLLTSGTSGFASGCVFGIDQLLLNGQRHADSIGQHSDDKVLVNLPLHYSFALVAQMLGTFARGGQLVIDGPPFNPVHYSRIVGEYGISVSALTPILARTLLHGGDRAAHSPRVLSVGGDTLGSEDVSRLLEYRPGKELYLTYGLTQAGPRVSTLAAHTEPKARYTSVGRPLAGTTVSFRPVRGDAATQELVVTSATVMRRRIGIVEGRSQLEDSIAGTVATGDVFEHDSDGYLFFRARLSDFIIKQGEKISLAGVRTVARQLPNVINAKTKVFRSEAGDEDFDLTLYVSTDGVNSADLLRRQLRRTEMPRAIHVEQGDRNSVPGHK